MEPKVGPLPVNVFPPRRAAELSVRSPLALSLFVRLATALVTPAVRGSATRAAMPPPPGCCQGKPCSQIEEFVELSELAQQVGLQGAADILLMAVMVYAGLALLRRSRAAAALWGLGLIGIIYVVARLFNLTLTARVLESFFAVGIIAVIVIFRDELRRFLETLTRVGVRSRRRTDAPRTRRREIDALAHAIGELARQRVGALVVCPGRVPVESRVEGGIHLDGKLSEPLLVSLFDPSSPGHDGAVVVQRGKVQRFGAHLPLSSNFAELGKHGTRHAAALGLAERSDAACFVVSEERGTISVAHEGRLHNLAGPTALQQALERFYDETPVLRARSWTDVLRHDWGARLAAVGISVALWGVVVYADDVVERTYTVQVETRGAAAGTEIRSIQPRQVLVTFSAPRRNFLLLGEMSVHVTLPVGHLTLGEHWVPLMAEHVSYPPDLRLRSIRPRRVRVQLEPE